uniref:Uncharacterized protein n=1 Tax=Trichobilharzia regenti TaxID=157069 RepID=A0AA85KJ15_TRIRE|nr:unnamed protein product [Trichobilharzia regenti]
MPYKFDNLQEETNKLSEEAIRKDKTSGEHREDGGDEDSHASSSSTTTTGGNGYKRMKFERSHYIRLSRKNRFKYRQLKWMKMSKAISIGKARQTFFIPT